jgi:hypothetical protein
MYKMEADSRIRAHHVSLYWALFQTWNEHRFQSPMRIYRDEMMSRAKIYSRSTYAKCMSELHEWKYVSYDPSSTWFEAAMVNIRRFDGGRNSPDPDSSRPTSEPGTGPETGPRTETKTGEDEDIPGDEISGTLTGTGSGTRTEPDDRTHNINSINNTNILNNLNANEQAHIFSDFGHDFTHPVQTPCAEEKSNARGGGGRADLPAGSGPEARPASLDHVNAFFASLYSPREEAEKFFHYFSSNGWKVGGRSDMYDWHAAARNWILNAKKYNPPSGPTPGSLASPGPQNYSEPL